MRAAMNPLYEQMKTSVFERMSLAAAKHGAVNLGQGFPDFGWPDEILDAAARALKEGSNQYAPSRGLPALREAVAAHYNRHFGQQLTADQVCVTSGATEALGAAILATVEPGDEVIIFTPAYDSYAPMIRRAGGTPVEVALEPPAWRVDRERLEAAISPKTRAIIFNNPHNPAGRLFDADELEAVAAIARNHDLIVISDEVWEHVLLDGFNFTPLATLARDGRADDQDRLGGQDFFAHRLEGGLDDRRALAGERCCARSSVPDICDRAQSSGRGRLRVGRGRCLDRTDACAFPARARPDDRRASQRRLYGA